MMKLQSGQAVLCPDWMFDHCVTLTFELGKMVLEGKTNSTGSTSVVIILELHDDEAAPRPSVQYFIIIVPLTTYCDLDLSSRI